MNFRPYMHILVDRSNKNKNITRRLNKDYRYSRGIISRNYYLQYKFNQRYIKFFKQQYGKSVLIHFKQSI